MRRALAICLFAVCNGATANAAGAPAASPEQGDLYGQPLSERSAQQALPQSHDTIWTTLHHTTITEDTKQGIYTARHPPEVQALVGKQLTVQGFILPYTTDALARHFLLTRYTPVCFFCPPGAPNEVIDLTIDKPVKWEDKLYSVSGVFAIQNDGEKGLFFRLDRARILEPVKLDDRGLPQMGGRER